MIDRILEHYLEEFILGCDVDPAEAGTLLDALIASDDAPLLAETLSAWNKKGVSEEELFAFSALMRERMGRIDSRHPTCVDMVGTGGSRSKTFNVSTAAAFVVAGAGLPVAKHGNRAATSSSGSTDVLTMLGIDIDVDPSVSERQLNENGLCFLFAPRFHSLSPVLAKARKLIGSPTIFNNIGPLCNPASAPHHVIGVWATDVLEKTANVLVRLGSKRSWVVHGETGLDEIELKGMTQVAEINQGKIDRFEISAADFGVYSLGKDLPSDCTREESAGLIRDILENRLKDRDPERLVLINASAALFVAGRSSNLEDAYSEAKESIRSGAAIEKLNVMAAGSMK